MKAAIFEGKGLMTVRETRDPVCGAQDVLVRVQVCGICGTDVHICEGAQGAAETTPPVILGHEFSGLIEAVGSAVTGLAVGDRVCVDPNQVCGQCEACQAGRAHFCTRMTGFGTTTDGGFAELCRVPASQAHRIADSVSFEEGAMAEPISCCLHGIDLCNLRPGAQVMVIGAGGIGLLMTQLAKLSGASAVIVLEPIAEKRALARTVGADLVLDPTTQDVSAALAERGLSQLDAVIECVGLRSTMLDAIHYAGKSSVAMLFGLGAPSDELPIKPFELFQKEVTIRASFINPYTMARAVALLNAGRLNLTALIGKSIPLTDLAETLAKPELRRSGKILVKPAYSCREDSRV